MPALPTGPLSLTFRLGSVPVVIQPSFWLGAFLLGMNLPGRALVLWVGVVLVSVLVHELGHAMAYRYFGAGAGIQLQAFGGLTFGDRALSRWRSLAVSLAGPFTGFALGGAVWAATRVFVPESYWSVNICSMLMFTSFAWGALNLLPILPLDGGHAVEQLLGPRYAHRLPAFSAIAGAVIAVAFAATGNSFAAVLFALLAVQNFQAWSAQGRAASSRPRVPAASPDEHQSWVQEGWKGLRQGDERIALQLGSRALAAARDERAAAEALDLLAWASLAASQPAQALEYLRRVPPALGRPYSWAMALEAADRPVEALPHALKALSAEPSDPVATLATRLLLRTGDVRRAAEIISGRRWANPSLEASLRAELALAEGRYPEAAEGFRQAFLGGGRSEDAVGAARAWVRAGTVERARAWLEEAGRAGFDARELSGDPELQALVAR